MAGLNGIIDSRMLGCRTDTCIIFDEHAGGKAVPQIADELGLPEGRVRQAITDVWIEDSYSAPCARRAGRKSARDEA